MSRPTLHYLPLHPTSYYPSSTTHTSMASFLLAPLYYTIHTPRFHVPSPSSLTHVPIFLFTAIFSDNPAPRFLPISPSSIPSTAPVPYPPHCLHPSPGPNPPIHSLHVTPFLGPSRLSGRREVSYHKSVLQRHPSNRGSFLSERAGAGKEEKGENGGSGVGFPINRKIA